MNARGIHEKVIVWRVIAGRSRPFRAEDLDTLIITVIGFEAIIDGGHCAILKPHGDNCRVNFPELANRWIDQGIANGVDFLRFTAAKKSHHIEIVNGHVEKDAAGNFNIVVAGRLRIAAGNSNNMRLTDAATDH